MSLPTVSAVIPTRDRPELLRKAIRGVAAQGAVGELVVVFDQTEPDRRLVDEFPDLRLRVVENQRRPGLAGARNTGILAANSDWVAFCDDDDEWSPDRLRKQFGAISAKPDSFFVVGGIRIRYGDRVFERVPGRTALRMEDLLRSRIMEAHPSTFLVRKEVILDGLGLVDEDLPGSFAEDYDWLLRAARIRPVDVVDEPLASVQWHSDSYFGSRWQVIFDALGYLVDKTPEFAGAPRGLARIEGQRAFALAALGRTVDARKLARLAMRTDPRELRSYLALAVSARLVSARTLVKLANSVGRGV